MQPIEPIYTELRDFNLIEASAGTGKTYTITALYLRLILEEGIPVSRILVVTYTNAATKALRDRIRERLSQLFNAFLRGYADQEDELGVRLIDLLPDRQLVMQRLNNAIRGFDEASIYTIHGFCKRALGDNAFESGLSFETDMMTDTSNLLHEIAEDFWRREFYNGSPAIVKYFLKHYSPETLLAEINAYLGKPYIEVIMPEGEADGAKLENAFLYAYQQARDNWLDCYAEIEDLLLNSKALNRNQYRKASISGWIEAMNLYLTAEIPPLSLFDNFEKFTTPALNKATKKNEVAPQHMFFSLCDSIKKSSEALVYYCQHQVPVKLLHYCNAELAARKQRQHVQSYDDLLLNLHRALHDPRRSNGLLEALRDRYRAALIDEFQDTDPVQYEIFHRIYEGTHKPVFLVGDPKQAIYSFRGADIFAYLNARHDTCAKRRHTLDVNWRSDPRLLNALNALFGNIKAQPFLFDDIPFYDAISARKNKHKPLIIQGRLEPPLQLWFLESDDPKKTINKHEAKVLTARATAIEIVRLLNLGAQQQAYIGERPLAGGDIAVLVRSHQEGRIIRQHLLQLGVPSVHHSDDSVFASKEAGQLVWLLAAVMEPSNEGQVRAALISDLWGLSGEDLYELQANEQAWALWLEKLRDYRQVWQEQGFIGFFRTWLVNEQVAQRLLTLCDGERRLTNLLHLAELLHIASHTYSSMAGLLKWLNDQHRLPANRSEEQQLRLETDENLVKIVTIHKSKGLEYEIVFCPFAWDGKLYVGEKDKALLYHDPDSLRHTMLAVGVGSNHPARQYARREEMAEKLRLFYVALTRAKQRCYLAWGKINESGTAPFAWLLHRPTVKAHSKDEVQATQERFNALEATTIRKELEAAFTTVADNVAIMPLSQMTHSAIRFQNEARYRPPMIDGPELQARTFTGVLSNAWRMSSFTSLVAGRPTIAEMPDHDIVATISASDERAPDEQAMVVSGSTIFDFPRGARAGTCLHAIFERLDFACHSHTDLEDLVGRTLSRHGLDAEKWQAVIVAMVQNVLATPLNRQGMTLARIKRNQRLDELEFNYPLAHLRADALRALLKQHGYITAPCRQMVENLNFSPVRGYMKGFIDLVFAWDGRFYLVDYKSNWLGMEATAYQRKYLQDTMAREAYHLQYLIYTVALHRYLRLRLPDYDCNHHLGGVFYLFLRGMEPLHGMNCGVFYDRPAPALVMALDHLMATGRSVA